MFRMGTHENNIAGGEKYTRKWYKMTGPENSKITKMQIRVEKTPTIQFRDDAIKMRGTNERK